MTKDTKASLLTVAVICACIYMVGAVWKWESEREFRQLYQRTQEGVR